jgi:hypothetical protein
MKYFLVTGEDRFYAGAACPEFDVHYGAWRCETGMLSDAGRQRQIQTEEDAGGAVETLPLLTPMTLYMAFKPAERIAIKASVDPMVQEFWAMYQLSVQLQKPTDPNLVSVRTAIAYLAAPVDPGPGAGILESPERVDEILAGIPQ